MFELDPHNDWRMEMLALARIDPWHAACAEALRRAEPLFLAIQASLPEDQQEALDQYISACEELQYSLIFSAYEVGKRHGLAQRYPAADSH